MRGLLLKDYYNIKSNAFIMILAFVVIGIGMSIALPNTIYIMGLSIIMFSTMSVTTIKLDMNAKWDKLVVTMSISRNKVVLSKFLLYFIMCLVGAVVGIIANIVSLIFMENFNGLELLSTASVGMGIAFFAGSLILPCALLLNPDKSEISMIISYTITSLVLVGGILGINNIITVKDNLDLLVIFYLFISLILYCVSYYVTIKIYNKKEI